eukprot:12219720-Alexandrium_andersonii.AAC.1
MHDMNCSACKCNAKRATTERPAAASQSHPPKPRGSQSTPSTARECAGKRASMRMTKLRVGSAGRASKM